MAGLKEILRDPDYQALSTGEQTEVRRSFYRQRVAPDPDFKALSTEEKHDVTRSAIFPGEKEPTFFGRLLEEEVKPRFKSAVSKTAGTALKGPQATTEKIGETLISSILPKETPAPLKPVKEAIGRQARIAGQNLVFTGPTEFFDFLDRVSTFIEDKTGLKKGGIFKRIADLSRVKEDEVVLPRNFPEKVVAGVSRAITGEIPKFGLATAAAGPAVGFAGLSALEAAAQGEGLKKVIEEGVKGALTGGSFKGAEHLTRSARIPALGTIGGTEAAVAGGGAEDIAEAATTLAILGAGRKGGVSPREAAADFSRSLQRREPRGEKREAEAREEPAFVEELLKSRPEKRPVEEILPGREPRAKIVKPARERVATEDQSLATYLNNLGGISIARSPKESGELRARRQSKKGALIIKAKKGLTLDQAAERAHEAGFIPEPSARALFEALDSEIEGRPVFSRKSAFRDRKTDLEAKRELERGDEILTERAADRKIEDLIKARGPLEFEGKRFNEAIKTEKGVRLKDDTDITLTKAGDILRVEKRAPVFEETEAGRQGVIPGAEGRSVPRGGIRPRRRQAEEPTDLERSTFEKDQDTIPFDVPRAGAEMEPGSLGMPGRGTRGTRGFPEIRRKEKDVPQTVTPMKRSYQPPDRTEARELVRRGDVIREMQDRLQVPIRTGHAPFGQMGARAFFRVKEEVIRLKLANDFEAAAHEVGHFLSKKLLSRQFSGKKAGGRRFDKELVDLGKALYGSRRPAGGYAEEGIAEFVRYYVLDPKAAKQKAPLFFEHFENLVNAKFPDVRDTLLKTREDYRRYREQPPVARILSQISIGEKQKRGRTFDDIYTKTLDGLHQLEVFTKRMHQGKDPLPITEDPYQLGRLFRGWMGKADVFLRGEPFNPRTFEPTGAKPLDKILKTVERDLDGFRAYWASRRAIELHKRGIESGMDPGDAKATVDLFSGRKEFRQAFDDIQKYADSLLRYSVERGVLSGKQYQKIKALNQEYAPFHRLAEDTEAGPIRAGAGKTFANLWNPVKRIKGSGKEILDPIETLIRNTYAIINVSERNAIGNALIKLAKKGEGLGKFVEEVDRGSLPVKVKDQELRRVLKRYGRIKETQSFQTSKKEFTKETGLGAEAASAPAEKMEKIVREALTRRGFSEGEAAVFISKLKGAKTPAALDKVIEKIVTEQTIIRVTKEIELDLPPDVIAAWRPDPRIPGKDNIVSIKIDGEPRLFQLHPDLYRGMMALDLESAHWLVKLGSMPAKTLRLGATVLNPEFAIRNPIKDQWTGFIQSKYGYKPPDFLRGAFHILKGEVGEGDKLYNLWRAAGGERSMLVSLDRPELQATIRSLLKGNGPSGIVRSIVRHPIDTARVLAELGEAATRVGEFKRGVRKEGLTPEGILKAAFSSREITVDFGRIGAKTQGLNQVTAFFNANLQGVDRFGRALKADPAGVLTRSLISITLPSMLFYLAQHDDPRYRELPRWQKDLFWVVLTGEMDEKSWAKMGPKQKAAFNREHTVWRIPKPFLPGLLFGSTFERILDWVSGTDPKALEQLKDSYFSAVPNPFAFTALVPLVENIANWSFFRERPIVPKSLEGVEKTEQSSFYTREIFKKGGKAISKIPGVESVPVLSDLQSPLKLENLVRGYTGGTGALVSELFSPEEGRPARRLADMPIVRALVARFPGQPQTVQDFYDELDESREAVQTLNLYRRQGRREEARDFRTEHRAELDKADRLNAAAEALSNLRARADRIRKGDLSPEEKTNRLEEISFRMLDVAERALRKRSEIEKRLGITLGEPSPLDRPVTDLFPGEAVQ